MDRIRIVGSDEAEVWVGRVPCIGETIRMHDLPRKVIAVEHDPMPAGWNQPEEPSKLWAVATVTVADE